MMKSVRIIALPRKKPLKRDNPISDISEALTVSRVNLLFGNRRQELKINWQTQFEANRSLQRIPCFP
ncbi:hypothetical protein SBDP1_520045 [Syntrophobacter sp. SbD1]|nr:hypothetical protein SBDP1_520045 [Syntrophobacter sp. SbD1]